MFKMDGVIQLILRSGLGLTRSRLPHQIGRLQSIALGWPDNASSGCRHDHDQATWGGRGPCPGRCVVSDVGSQADTSLGL